MIGKLLLGLFPGLLISSHQQDKRMQGSEGTGLFYFWMVWAHSVLFSLQPLKCMCVL